MPLCIKYNMPVFTERTVTNIYKVSTTIDDIIAACYDKLVLGFYLSPYKNASI